MTLTEFLLARIAEDEARASTVHRQLDADIDVTTRIVYDDRLWRECEAKRRIVDEHAGDEAFREWCAARSYMYERDCQVCEDGPGREHGDIEHQQLPCPTLRHLASVYADHPDYRAEWTAA